MLRSGRKFRKKEGTETETSARSYNPTHDCHPALLTDVVLHNIFTFIEYTYLKDCRLVCHKWRSISEPIFRKRTNVLFPELAVSEDFYVLQRLFSYMDVPITALELSGPPQLKATQLQSFFRNEGRSITKLKVEQFNVLNKYGRPCQIVDINHLVTTNLKELFYNSIDFIPGFDKVKSVIGIETLLTLDSISFTGGTIILNDDVRISPKDLRLSYNKFIRNGRPCSQLSLQEFVNFDRIETLEIQPPYGDTVSLSVDLQGSVTLKELSLFSKLILTNWEISRWRINKLSLHSTPFLLRNQMMVTELHLYNSKVDLYVLPPTIKKLIVRMCHEVTCSSPINLIQLQCLKSENNENLDFIRHFSSCNNLVELIIGNGRPSDLNIDYIPKSVERIFLNSQNKFVGDTPFELESLVVSNIWTEPKYMNQFISCKLHPKNLILNIDPGKIHNSSMINCNSHFKRIIRFRKNKFENVVLGAFKWSSESPFVISYLSEWVDKSGQYYIFKNGGRRGTAITLKQIHEMVFGDEKAYKDCKSTYWLAFQRTINLY